MSPRIYIDTNVLQALIHSGIYDDVRARMAQLGYELATTTRVLYELGRGEPKPEVDNWLKNKDSNIITEIHPDSVPWDKNAGERGIRGGRVGLNSDRRWISGSSAG